MYEPLHATTLKDGMEALRRDGRVRSMAKTRSFREPKPSVAWNYTLMSSGSVMQPIRVLVIEDSEVHVRLIRGMLAGSAGTEFVVETFQRLSAGLDRLAEGNIDVILLDLSLPDSEGLESCRRVADEAPELPIVVLTSLDDEEAALGALQYGAQDYLIKGQIDRNLLSRSLRYAIERKRGELELQRAHDELEQRVEERTAELRLMQEAARRQQEELAHAARLNTLGGMASGMAHELNQPLMAIIGFTDTCLQMLQSKRLEVERFAEILADTSSEARRAGEIIKRLRKLVSRRPSQHTPVELNELVRETVPLFGRGLGVKLSFQLADSLPNVLADRIQVQQVLLNLTSNAIQAMESTHGAKCELTIKTGLVAGSKMVYAEVCDTGPGLPPDELRRVFEPFFTRKKDGLGLGLSICRSIMESHAGQLTAEENSDGGLTFRFILPVKREISQQATQNTAETGR